MAILRLWVRPGAPVEQLSWDPWRESWVVACSAPAREGEANRRVLELLAGWLGVDGARLRFRSGAAHRAKIVEVDGLTGEAAESRLRQHAGPPLGDPAGPHRRPSADVP